MNKSLLLIFYFFTHLFLFGQKQVLLYDSTENTVIKQATINGSDASLKLFSVSDSLGRFDIKKFNNSYILIKHLGYEDKLIKATYFVDTIYLNPRKHHIPEVLISPKKKYKTYELGNYRMKIGFLLFNHYIGRKGTIIATLINCDHRNSTIDGILISKKKETKSSTYKVYLFTVNGDGRPGDTIFSRVVNQSQLSEKDVIPTRNLNLKIPPEGIFIGFQWIEDKDYDNYLILNLTTEVEKNNTYIYYPNNKNRVWLPLNNLHSFNNARVGFRMKPPTN